jgi:dolichyl-phosphate-mannose-protein mannosyltransferase
MYFDEGYFVPEARAFLEGTPNPNPQCPPLAKPPLGKLIMAIGMKAAGDNPFGWRIASAVCGALTLTAMYLWCFLLLGDARLACLATGLALFNNFVYVMSRIGTMDAFLLVFLIWSLVSYTAALSLDIGVRLRRFLFVCSGALIGLAGACKWNAIDTLAIFLLVSFVLLGHRARAGSSLWRYTKSMREIGILTAVLGLLVAPIAAYSLAFWPLCLMIHRPFSVHELATMNVFMWKFNSTAISNKALTSAWYTWPMNLRPQRVLSYLVGNPVVTWGGLMALGFCAWRLPKRAEFAEGLVLLLFFSNYLQWAVTPEKGLFYYYYYPCVMILGVAIAVALRNLPRRVLGMRISLLVLVAAISVFAWCYPRMANLEAPWDCILGCWS